VLQMALLDPSITDVVAMTRCSQFLPVAGRSIEETQEDYEAYVKSGRDPTLFFHMSGGAEVLAILEGYRPEDVDNLGNAVLIDYNVENVRFLNPYLGNSP
jgi:hypothetical protein